MIELHISDQIMTSTSTLLLCYLSLLARRTYVFAKCFHPWSARIYRQENRHDFV